MPGNTCALHPAARRLPLEPPKEKLNISW